MTHEKRDPTPEEKAAADIILAAIAELDIGIALNVMANVTAALIASHFEPADHEEEIDTFHTDLLEMVPHFSTALPNVRDH